MTSTTSCLTHSVIFYLLVLFISLCNGTDPAYLYASALVSDPKGNARIQCWKFVVPFSTYPTIGMALHLANTTNMTYVVLPPHSEEGLHKPPHPMFFVLLSGVAHVTLPSSSEELWITEGVNGLIVAADTPGVGHYTAYPSDKPTVALQIPFAGGTPPEHVVVGETACSSDNDRLVVADMGGGRWISSP